MWPDTRLTDLFGIELPIVQAPMANATAIDMAVAVANAGGLGSYPCAALTDDKVAEGVATIRSRTNRPINLNFFCHQPAPPDETRDAAWLKRLAPYYAELGAEMPKLPLKASIVPFTAATCAVVEQLAPAVVSFHFGLPEPELVARVKRAGCKIISSATSLREAQFLAAGGVDAIIAQGAEAGGHRGMFIETDVATQIGTLALVHEIVNAVRVPVIAAGGIVDGRTMAAAFALGAEGVQMGTRMVSSAESPVHQNWKDMILAAKETDTVFLNRFGPGPALRALRTEKTTQFEKAPPPNIMGEFGNALDLYFGGDMEASIALSGQVAGRIDAVKPVKQILEETIAEFDETIAGLGAKYGHAPALT
jgi:nitronate monooxygenase